MSAPHFRTLFFELQPPCTPRDGDPRPDASHDETSRIEVPSDLTERGWGKLGDGKTRTLGDTSISGAMADSYDQPPPAAA